LPQVLARLESTYQLKFATNIQVAKWKAWWQTLPRSSDRRYTAIQFRCNEISWQILRNSIGTNFMGPWQASAPYGWKLQERVPWITIVGPGWYSYPGRFFTREPDQWLHVHQPDIYFDPASNPTNLNVIIFVEDRRAEINEPSYYRL